MNKYVELLGRGAIISSCMVATNEVIGYHANPYKSATGTRLACNIAGYSIGFYLGKRVANCVIGSIKDAVKAYNGEEE